MQVQALATGREGVECKWNATFAKKKYKNLKIQKFKKKRKLLLQAGKQAGEGGGCKWNAASAPPADQVKLRAQQLSN